jgi:hypothetical protein
VARTADTGTFWFFDSSNVEVILKVLDGHGVNGHEWVFYGALSNVEYTLTVTDTETGLTRVYFNPAGNLASVGDTHAFGPGGASVPAVRSVAPPSPAPLVSTRTNKAEVEPCVAGAQRLCLNNGRFAVDVTWKDFQNHTGTGTAVPFSGDTGSFWFFDAANVELVVKVLDGRGVNGHVWVFYGALSNVEYTLTVTDTATGLARRYFNPIGQFASVGDTHGFGPLGAYGATPAVASPSPLPLVAERVDRRAAIAPCQPSAQRLCLNGDRFAVEVSWKDFQNRTGTGKAVPLSGDTGTFWFFDAANVELIVKILDGGAVNGHVWVFYGALTNVEYTLTVTDTASGTIRTYTNPRGRFASVGDTQAF